MNVITELQAKQRVDSQWPDKIMRTIGLTILAEAIQEAHRCGKGTWIVQFRDRPRLLIGNHVALILSNQGFIWLALDTRIREDRGSSPIEAELNGWGWYADTQEIPGAYPNYKDAAGQDISVNGYYKISSAHAHAGSWPHVRQPFFDFIKKINALGEKMDPHGPEKHTPGMLAYIRTETGIELPDPVY